MTEMGILTLESDQLTVAYGSLPFAGVAVSMGNPHFVVFAKGANAISLERTGLLSDWSPVLCDHTKVSVAHIDDADEICMCVWVCASDTTQACSSRHMVSPRETYLSASTVTVFDARCACEGLVWVTRCTVTVYEGILILQVGAGAFFLAHAAVLSATLVHPVCYRLRTLPILHEFFFSVLIVCFYQHFRGFIDPPAFTCSTRALT